MTRTTSKALLISAAAGALFLALPVLAQSSNVTAANKFSYSENCGWMNWRDAGNPAASQGALIIGTVLSGFVWGENTGWINLGDGVPANGVSYSNTTGSDFGVNLDASGALSGLAWGENVGWINFTLPTLPVNQRPVLDRAASRLRGYAWGENIGWINLDSAEEGKHVGVRTCVADFNQDGDLNPDDLGDYITCYFTEPPCPGADFNADNDVNPDDLGDYITAYFQGCP